ncbi:MAG: aminotransferase class IV [Weeksellaceae bacterium]|nr:aminotransferase class IV [Weeksellaceae bacterium]
MCQYFETIRIEDGKICHLDWHQKRLTETFVHKFTCAKPWDLQEILGEITLPSQGIHKLKIIYDAQDFTIEISPYSSKIINSIGIIESPTLQYPFKSTDRSALEIPQEHKVDDVIFTQNGFLTDSSYANLCFMREDKWYTPTTYLLNGTYRQRLLAQKQIHEDKIHLDDFQHFTHMAYINAMLPLGRMQWELSALDLKIIK